MIRLKKEAKLGSAPPHIRRHTPGQGAHRRDPAPAAANSRAALSEVAESGLDMGSAVEVEVMSNCQAMFSLEVIITSQVTCPRKNVHVTSWNMIILKMSPFFVPMFLAYFTVYVSCFIFSVVLFFKVFLF